MGSVLVRPGLLLVFPICVNDVREPRGLHGAYPVDYINYQGIRSPKLVIEPGLFY
jgi:hypothetical protein